VIWCSWPANDQTESSVQRRREREWVERLGAHRHRLSAANQQLNQIGVGQVSHVANLTTDSYFHSSSKPEATRPAA
jgi:hypothetical protein